MGLARAVPLCLIFDVELRLGWVSSGPVWPPPLSSFLALTIAFLSAFAPGWGLFAFVLIVIPLMPLSASRSFFAPHPVIGCLGVGVH